MLHMKLQESSLSEPCDMQILLSLCWFLLKWCTVLLTHLFHNNYHSASFTYHSCPQQGNGNTCVGLEGSRVIGTTSNTRPFFLLTPQEKQIKRSTRDAPSTRTTTDRPLLRTPCTTRTQRPLRGKSSALTPISTPSAPWFDL